MEQTLHHIVSMLESKGHRLGPKRMVVMEALCREREVQDIEVLWMTLRQSGPIGWSTVYNTINLLARAGVLVRHPESKRRQSFSLLPEVFCNTAASA